METGKPDDDEAILERAMTALEAQICGIGAHLTIDSSARLLYLREIRSMSDKLRGEAVAGRITWAAAAKEAQETRNLIMDAIRSRSTPVGKAFATSMKLKGYSLNQLVALKTIESYGQHAVFSHLSKPRQNRVYADIVASAGKSNLRVTRAMTRLTYAGRGVLFLAVAISTYHVATAPNKATALKRELATNGAGLAGGLAGGALAGLACGPAAPVCVTVGAFIGGALAAFGTAGIW